MALDMFRYPVMWLLIIRVCFNMLGYVVQVYSLSPFTISSPGYSSKQAKAVFCWVGIIVRRPLVGFAADIFGAGTTGIFCYLIVGILYYGMWIPCRNHITVVMFGLARNFDRLGMAAARFLNNTLGQSAKLEAVYPVV